MLKDNFRNEMNMEIKINITSFEPEVKVVVRDDDLKGFVTWIFMSDIGKVKIAGGTIRVKEFGVNKVRKLSYDVPAIKTKGNRYFKVFYIDNLDIYRQLCKTTIDKYIAESGGLPEGVILDSPDETVNPDDIPF